MSEYDNRSQGIHSVNSRESSRSGGSRSAGSHYDEHRMEPVYEDDDDDDVRSYNVAEEEGGGEQKEGEAFNFSRSVDFGESHGSFLDPADRNDPNYLFGVLQDALPKQTECISEQQKRDQAELVWEKIRRWLWANPQPEQREAAADVRGAGDATCLHLVCKLHNPPEDIVVTLVDAALDTTQWTDQNGWLPLHHACAYGASPEVIKILVDAYPHGKVTQDQQNRTPLHFYATRNSDNPATMGINTEILSDTGAAALQDRSGMLPIHYAAAYGSHPAVLKVLAKVNPRSLSATENNGRTPMHLSMSNALRDESPNVVRFLLNHSESRASINIRDKDGHTPLHLLAQTLKADRKPDMEKRPNASECLSMYLAAEPAPFADFLTGIQDLPEWLQDTAVVSKHVRNILNAKIVQRFPTSILMLDGIFLVVLIVCFAITTRNHINIKFDPDYFDDTPHGALAMVFVGASYFLLREVVQFASLMSLGSISSWWTDPGNYMDIAVIVLTFYYGTVMVSSDSGLDGESFRSGVAFTQGILWMAIIVYLKSTLVDFAVFVGGVFYVVQRLVAFLIAVAVILLAFAQMFYFIYLNTNMCLPTENVEAQECNFPHCTFEYSLLKVYTMMMGEIGDETRYSTNLTAQILYVGYAFLVVILLSNVLIAIVTDSYEIIQNDRAAIVFWSNRLDFVAEMDAITYAVQRRLLGKKSFDGDTRIIGRSNNEEMVAAQFDNEQGLSGLQGLQGPTDDTPLETAGESLDVFEESTELFREAWHQVLLLFDTGLYDGNEWIETWVYNIFRIFSIFFVIPLWLALGAITAGWLWPPQIREWLFVQKETAISRSELERKKLAQLTSIQADLKTLKQEIMREMASDRDEMIRMKAEVETVQGEVYADLQQVKELMDSLLMH